MKEGKYESIGEIQYWVDQKVCSGFSVRWYRKAHMNFLVNSTQSLGSFKNLLKISSPGFFNVYLTQLKPFSMYIIWDWVYLWVIYKHKITMYNPSVSVFYYWHYKLSTQNNTNMFSYDSIDAKSKMGLEGLKSRCQQDCVPSRSSRRKFISLPFPACRGCQNSLLLATSFWPLPLSSHLPFWLWPVCFLLIRTLVNTLVWPSQKIQDNHSISRSLT